MEIMQKDNTDYNQWCAQGFVKGGDQTRGWKREESRPSPL